MARSSLQRLSEAQSLRGNRQQTTYVKKPAEIPKSFSENRHFERELANLG
jgi:hypothetical protein